MGGRVFNQFRRVVFKFRDPPMIEPLPSCTPVSTVPAVGVANCAWAGAHIAGGEVMTGELMTGDCEVGTWATIGVHSCCVGCCCRWVLLLCKQPFNHPLFINSPYSGNSDELPMYRFHSPASRRRQKSSPVLARPCYLQPCCSCWPRPVAGR
jgi:hypothetical protein